MTFEDELSSVKREAQKMKDAGVQVVIGLSQAGYDIDKRVAHEVDNIDVIVGGHSHTFLYTGKMFWDVAMTNGCYMC